MTPSLDELTAAAEAVWRATAEFRAACEANDDSDAAFDRCEDAADKLADAIGRLRRLYATLIPH